MQIEQLLMYLDEPVEARQRLQSIGLRNLKTAHANLAGIAASGMSLDLVAEVCNQLAVHLSVAADPDMALNNLERFISASRNPIALGSLLERDAESLPILLQIFSTSQYLSDVMIRDPESFDLLRLTEGMPVSRETLIAELCKDTSALRDEKSVMADLRRFKHRETLRIAYGDIVRNHELSVVTRQISWVADAICQAALDFQINELQKQRGAPRTSDGSPARFVVLAMGKLGGGELNYSSDIDLIFLFDEDGSTDGERPISNREFYERLAKSFVKTVGESAEFGACYRVDLRLRPDGSQGPLVVSLNRAVRYYDVSGRTWERQALMKARPIAGDIDLGEQFLEQMASWIYRRYLSRADINEVKALKRRIEQRASRQGDARNVKTGHGGIRDIEFVIQFLQLLNGAEAPETRTGNTLEAIIALESAGCITHQERTILASNYAFLRKIEHLLQIMFNLQTHSLPASVDELTRFAVRMGYESTDDCSALEAFESELAEKTTLNRKILDHLLHDAFSNDGPAEPEVDLVLDPDPSEEAIQSALAKHGFEDIPHAYENLMALATETIPFLSARRCRMFLAAIAPRLLEAIAQTPDPDATLVSLCKVSHSLGGKGVLWELFSFNPPSLKLYVQLCAAPYLSSILISNPGMIDELLDWLLLDRLPTLESLSQTLAELCRGAEDIEPILHSFKNSQHLRVGVRDILGKDDVRDTHRALSDIAEVVLATIADREYERLVERFGEPTVHGGPRDGQLCRVAIMALGKLGGREPNYHSDLDIVFLYEASGFTQHKRSSKSTSNQHFFSQLGQRIIQVGSRLTDQGRLYEIDPRLRPTGKNGPLAVSLEEFERYFREQRGQLWERQSLCKARMVYGEDEFKQQVLESVQSIVTVPWQSGYAREIREMRIRMQENASERNLKRGPGGAVDVEFVVQALQLKHGAAHPAIRTPGTFEAIAALEDAGLLSAADAQGLANSYRFLRSIEVHLRLMNTAARHDLPASDAELKKLAFMLGYAQPEEVIANTEQVTQENRSRFERIFGTL